MKTEDNNLLSKCNLNIAINIQAMKRIVIESNYIELKKALLMVAEAMEKFTAEMSRLAREGHIEIEEDER